MTRSLRTLLFRSMLAVLVVTAAIRLAVWTAYQAYETAQGHVVAHEQINEALILLLVEVLALVILGFMLWNLSRHVLSPLRAVANAARLIAQGRLGKRVRLEHLPAGELRDIAEAINASFDRYQEAIDCMARFSSAASHQLRTPLTAIRTTAELALEQENDGTGCRQAMESILEETKQLDRMTEQLLLLSRLDIEYLRERFEPVDLNALVRRVMEMYEPLFESAAIEIHLDLAEHCIVRGDATLLMEATTNLVDNAAKCAGLHGVIELATDVKGDTAILRVGDSGPGIDPAFREQIFGRFNRHPSTPYAGSGLGLSIVAEVVRLHDGHTRVGASTRGGAEFHLAFPCATARSAPSQR